MILIEETTIGSAGLPLARFKQHLRLGTGFTDDTLQDAVLEGFLRAAISALEARTGKALITREFSWQVTGWSDRLGQALPIAPVTAILAVSLRNHADETEVIDPALYRLEQDTHRPILRPTGSALPAIPSGGLAELRFVAGFGAFDDLPPDLAQAVMLLAAHYYEYRDDTALGAGCMPFGVTSLIERYRTVRILGGGTA